MEQGSTDRIGVKKNGAGTLPEFQSLSGRDDMKVMIAQGRRRRER